MTVPHAPSAVAPAESQPGSLVDPAPGATVAPTIAVIVVAAGSGVRLGQAEPKAFVLLHMRTLLDHALDSIFGMRASVQIVIVAPHDRVADARAIAERAAARHETRTSSQPGASASAGASAGASGSASASDASDRTDPAAAARVLNAVTVVAGGRTRQDSVDQGVAALLPSIDVVLVHDAARALTPAGLCDAVVDAVRATGHGIIPGLPVVDTIKRVAASGAILGTVDRSELSAVQTPQGFPRAMLAAARAWAVQNGRFEALTDDAALVADAGHPVTVITGDALAFKITTPEDLERADLILRAASGIPHPVLPRIGTGLDVHAFAADDTELWLAGLYWPGERGLSGHSDGDVAAHAICDALLGAAGLGDIGSVFGTADPRFSGAHGDVFLTETMRLVTAAGYQVGNVSVQIIGNRPKFSPRRAEAETRLAGILSAPINIAATTTDALGFTGRGEGVAATATALLYPLPSAAPDPGQTPDLNWEA